MGKRKGEEREMIVGIIGILDRYAARSFEIVCVECAFERMARTDRTLEVIKRPGDRFRADKGEILFGIGIGGKHSIDFVREGGRQVPGSLLKALAAREGVSVAEKKVLEGLAYFVATHDASTVPSEHGLAGLFCSYYNVTRNTRPGYYVSQFRGAFRAWWDRMVREAAADIEAGEIAAQWDEAGQGEGAIVGSEVSLGALDLLFKEHGLDFLVVHSEEGLLQEVLWAPGSRVAHLVDSAVTEGLGSVDDQEYAKWEPGYDDRLGVRIRYLLQGRSTKVKAEDVFRLIMMKIGFSFSPMPLQLTDSTTRR